MPAGHADSHLPPAHHLSPTAPLAVCTGETGQGVCTCLHIPCWWVICVGPGLTQTQQQSEETSAKVKFSWECSQILKTHPCAGHCVWNEHVTACLGWGDLQDSEFIMFKTWKVQLSSKHEQSLCEVKLTHHWEPGGRGG